MLSGGHYVADGDMDTPWHRDYLSPLPHLLEHLPNRYPRTHRHIERMFCAVLGDFYAEVAEIHDAVVNALDFVAKDEGNFWVLGKVHLVNHDALLGLLDGDDGVAVGLEVLDGVNTIGTMPPLHRLLRTEGCLADFGVGRTCRDAAQQYFRNAEGVGGAENGADIEGTPHIVEHKHHRRLVAFFELIHRNAVELLHRKFFHREEWLLLWVKLLLMVTY